MIFSRTLIGHPFILLFSNFGALIWTSFIFLQSFSFSFRKLGNRRDICSPLYIFISERRSILLQSRM